MIQAAQQCSIQETEQHQGVGLNTTPLSVDDRRAIYDFVVEVHQLVTGILQLLYNFQRLQGKSLVKRRMTYIEMILILNVSHSILWIVLF